MWSKDLGNEAFFGVGQSEEDTTWEYPAHQDVDDIQRDLSAKVSKRQSVE